MNLIVSKCMDCIGLAAYRFTLPLKNHFYMNQELSHWSSTRCSSITVPGGGQGGNCPPKFPRFGQNSNFSGSNKKYLGEARIFRAAI